MSTKPEITQAEQEARAQLREMFLRGVNELNGEPCTIITFEQTELNATFSGWQPDGTEILVRDLKTPANSIIPTALLRTPDMLAVHFERPVLLP